ncbi:serrate RNA effector molecule homolog isoform X2 [Dreissena polymorpha]|uniref:serrate RNA effector molecule homolog isoform X2 n=1 Tax=Dreissena polymorpha TaxID=45954 RepID=UPI002265632C|nr:serrate RNA effector molecule homolog isoform X2 [Dreissena polymorpha]
MADSDEEYERRKVRDKFRRERNDYEHRRDDRRRDWDHERVTERYESRGWRGRDTSAGRRDPYGRDYDRARRERYSSPPRRDFSPPHKRMRREWDDMGPYEAPHYGGGGPMHGRGHPPNWGPGPNMGPPPEAFGGPGQTMPDPEFPTQPPMMSFKMFLGQQEDTISDQDAVKKYNEYKEEFRIKQINEFFLQHKEEEWFKSKYHPEEFEKRQEEVRCALKRRCDVFFDLMKRGYMDSISCDTEQHEGIVKLLDAAVILMEGGQDEDLKVLEEPEEEMDTTRSRNNSETVEKMSPEKKKDGDAGPDKPMEITINAEQKELAKKAQEFSKKQQEIQNGDSEDEDEKPKKKKRHRGHKQEYNYESGSESDSSSGSSSDSDSEPAPPGMEKNSKHSGSESGALDSDSEKDKPTKKDKEKPKKKDDSEKKADAKAEGEEGESGSIDSKSHDGKEQPRRNLHKTCSIFLRNLAPSITKQEVEAVCKRYPGFIRVALQDPQPERRFLRRGWVTFDRNVNIKEICWNLNNIRLRDCDLGATLNRELKQRVRPVSGITAHHKVVKQDIKLAAKIIQNFDDKWKIWDDPNDEKKDSEKEFALTVKNPVLKNITDYLVDEGSFEEDELLGIEGAEEGEETNPEVTIERDETLLKVLDTMILYLRIVHSIDYYSANEYPNEDEMPHRCGIMHCRGVPPSSKTTKKDLDDWLKSFETKIKPFVELQDKLDDEKAKKMGKKDRDAEVEKFITANTQELAKDKWLCPLSGKKFKGPEFVRKHIQTKHGEKIEEVKQEVSFFNNYLIDPKRPSLPEHPGNKTSGPPTPQAQQFPGAGPGFGGPPQGMIGFNAHRGGGGPHMMRGGYGGNPYYHQGQGHFGGPRHEPREGGGFRERENTRPAGGYSRPYSRGSDPRRIIEYRDLDAPEEPDLFS